MAPGSIPYGYEVLFPAYSDKLAYHLNLIKIDGSFDRTKQHARINEQAYVFRDHPQISRPSCASTAGRRLRVSLPATDRSLGNQTVDAVVRATGGIGPLAVATCR